MSPLGGASGCATLSVLVSVLVSVVVSNRAIGISFLGDF